MKKTKKTPVILFFIFCLLLSITTLISFSSNTTTQEVLIKSIKPVYDENSTIKVDNNNVVFNDKNQVVKYNVVLENNQDYDVKISDIKLSTPTEEFLQYKVEGISTADKIKANSTKELTISFETMGIKGWGRNFEDELTANISFEKYIKPPEAPATDIEELINNSTEIEIDDITNNDLEIKDDIGVKDGDEVETWIYPDKDYLGFHEIESSKESTKIIGIVDTIKESEVNPGEHIIALKNEEKTLGYINIYINEDEEVLKELPKEEPPKEEEQPKEEDTKEEETPKKEPPKEENPKEENTDKEDNKPTEEIPNEGNTSNKDEEGSEKEEILPPNTSDKGLLIILIVATTITGISIIIVSKNKFTKYSVLVILLSSTLTITKAEVLMELPLTFNINFESQNIMRTAFTKKNNPANTLRDYWEHREKIKNFYIQNEIKEISEYAYKFDVTEAQNNRVVAYLVTNQENSNYYDLYLQADGIIYPNENARYYFYGMKELNLIDNINGIDTSNVTNMLGMFCQTGYNSETFTLDVSDFDTSNVTKMESMFNGTGYNSKVFTLDLSNFDTSNVTNMNSMFANAGYSNPNFTLDVSNFDTSNVTNMSAMFQGTGKNSTVITLDLSNFDTSNVTNMNAMFSDTGGKNPDFSLDLRNFNTSNVTTMQYMFYYTGDSSENFTLDVSSFDTSNVTTMDQMFRGTGQNSTVFTLDLSNFDTSKVTNMQGMFWGIGNKNPTFTLDVSKFDTSNVTVMNSMFRDTGCNSTVFTLDLSNFDTSKVTNMGNMFDGTGYNSENFTLDISNFDTSNVTIMYSMFYKSGYNNPNFTLNLGEKFDTSKVTHMDRMFSYTGYNSTKLNTSITIKNPNTTVYSNMFNKVATKEGSKIKVNYTNETEELVDQMIATKSAESNVVKGNLIVDIDNLAIGYEIHISGEKFNVISQTDDTITMLAQLNLGSDYKQSTTSNGVTFANKSGWEYTPGPKEIDIETWSANAKPYINSYVEYLKNELDSQSITGDLITLKELKQLGCTISDEYTYSSTGGYTCSNSPYKLWLVNNQSWWTRSANSKYSQLIWLVSSDGNLNVYSYGGNCGVRPVITISKETLRNLT